VDTDRLDRILAVLPPDDADYLSALVEPPWKARERRLSRRDAAVLDAFAAVSGKDPTPAATYIAEQFARYLGSAWLIERGYPLLASENPLRAALQRLARENGGETIGPRQLLRIRDGARR
jgi:hypothetical protein